MTSGDSVSRRSPVLASAAVAVSLVLSAGCTAADEADAPQVVVKPARVESTPLASPTPRAEEKRARKAVRSKPTPKPKPAARTMSRSKPVSVRIPAIDVESTLTNLGLNSDGTMEVPRDWDQVGWYYGSPTPGELGPATLAGHVDSKTGPAVFYRLRDLRRGDRIRVARKDGTTAVFAVTKAEQYPKDSFPTKQVYGNLSHAGLRLITCGGDFDADTNHYRENLVVYAKLVGRNG